MACVESVAKWVRAFWCEVFHDGGVTVRGRRLCCKKCCRVWEE